MTSLVRVDLFGGVQVGVAGVKIPVPSIRASVLLAMLVLARGDVVSSAELKAALWPSGEPTTAVNQLHRLVGQVRRLLEADLSAREAGAFITGTTAGYRLDPSRLSSDLADCETSVEHAQRLSGQEDWDAAAGHYLAALEILRRPLLGDVAWEGSGQPAFASVARTRAAVAVEALSCARHSERVPEVVALV